MVDMAELGKSAAEAAQRRKDEGLPTRKTPLEKLAENPKSRARAMDAMCYTCQGGSESTAPDSGWRWAIGNCQVLSCPLHAFRPYQAKNSQKPEGVYRGHDL